MPYRYLDDRAVADVAFEARGESLSSCFAAACDAALGVMVEDPASVAPRAALVYTATAEELDMLLFGLLGEIVYRRDADGLLLRCPAPRVEQEPGGAWTITARLEGEAPDPSQHRLLLDVKAVTLHLLCVERVSGEWVARAVLDV